MPVTSTAHLLVVAGHDSSGRAGLDADREAVAAAGCSCVVVPTAWTRQEGDRVLGIEARAPELWLEEARRMLAGGVSALKLGLLPGADAVRAAAELLAEAVRAGVPCVVDPVLGASSGERFLDTSATDLLREQVLSLPVVLTPNLPEACELAGGEGAEGVEVSTPSPEARLAVARTLLALGLGGVVLKGGHGREDPVVDWVVAVGEEPVRVEQRRVAGDGIRGSGCRHAATLASWLGRGAGLAEAAERSAAYVAACIRDRA